jgi:hypothetical protein
MAAQGQNPYTLMTQAISGLKAAAAGGGFTVDPQGGKYLIDALTTMRTKIESALLQVEQLTWAPLPLGTSPGAQAYGPFFASIATDPHQGALAVWKQLKDDLTDGINTIQTAMNNYQQTDTNNAGHLRGPQ